jgi:hypothetical protein
MFMKKSLRTILVKQSHNSWLRVGVRLISILLLMAISFGVWSNHWQQKSQLQPRSIRPLSASLPVATTGLNQQADDPLTESPTLGMAVQMDISPPLREIAIPPYDPPTIIREMGEAGEMERIRPVEERPQIEDPVVQTTFTRNGQAPEQVTIPAPGVNFEGVWNRNGVYPPDPNGDVGPNHYVQMVNLSFQVWNKNGASLYGPVNANILWSGFSGPCQTRNDGDPIVLYDQLADRWIVSQFTAASPYGECIAISTSGDPTGSYYRYFFQFSTSVFYDYPKLAVWPDGYYLTANRFSTFFLGASAIVLERDKMLNGQPARYVEFRTSGFSYGALLPSDLEGYTSPPAGSPAYFLELGTSSLHLWKFRVNWVNTASSTFSSPITLSIAAYNELCQGTRSCIPQPGTSVKVDGIGDRLMHRLVYRNFTTHETLVVSHSVNAATSDTRAGIRWYEIRNPNGTPGIYQQGTYAPADGANRWLPSITLDKAGNIALVYSVSSSSVYPSIRYAGRLASDPLGQLTQGESTLKTGSGSQTETGSRWGDYAMIAVDPTDDCTFWMTSQYLSSTGTAPWRTWIGAFKFPSCGQVGNLSGLISDAVTYQSLPGVQVQIQGYAAGSAVYQTTSGSSGLYLFGNLPVGVYRLTATLVGYYPTQVGEVTITNGAMTTQDLALQPYPYKFWFPLVYNSFQP